MAGYMATTRVVRLVKKPQGYHRDYAFGPCITLNFKCVALGVRLKVRFVGRLAKPLLALVVTSHELLQDWVPNRYRNTALIQL